MMDTQYETIGLRIPLGNSVRAFIPLGIPREDFDLMMATIKLWENRIVTPDPRQPGDIQEVAK